MPADPIPVQPTNRLAHEKSPYLLQHAHNPVDWYPWGEEAFEKARKENKPIFLSVGYSTCHWCHVMAHESFENPQTAAVMNELFVNIKVDREERPDVDRVYMTFVQATTGSGGWPMSVWLQPDLTPIVGGTYFPPDDRYGRRGFVSVCRSVAKVWHDDQSAVRAQGEKILGALRDFVGSKSAESAGGATAPIRDVLRKAIQPLSAAFDPDWGGFGNEPKFPRPVTLALLAQIRARLGSDDKDGQRAEVMLLGTLDHMAAGGIHDHLGGGFHRYSVDRYWHVPHFEKMLYDQAQLVVANLEAFQLSGSAAYANTARDILAYVRRDLTLPEGGFYCAEDADSLISAGHPEHAEGAFYVWTKAEIDQALNKEEAAAFCARYSVQAEGNAPPGSDPQGEFTGKNILFVHPAPGGGTPSSTGPGPDTGLLESATAKMLAVRSRRPRPHLDDKIVTGWNGLMISGFARAAQILGEPAYLTQARQAADFIRKFLYRESDGTLLRSYRQGASSVEGFADDYAFLVQGLLDLYEAGFNLADLVWAERLQTKQDELFLDRQGGGYFSSVAHDASVLLRIKDDNDGAEPSASSVAALNLTRLATMTGRDELRAQAAATVAAFGVGEHPERSAQAMPLLLTALDVLSDEPKQIVVAGHLESADTQALLRVIHRRFLPGEVLLLADGGEGQRELARRLPFLGSMGMLDGRAAAYVCSNGACQLPTTDPDQLAKSLAAAR